jgi:hypothetical protein
MTSQGDDKYAADAAAQLELMQAINDCAKRLRSQMQTGAITVSMAEVISKLAEAYVALSATIRT